MSNSQKEEGKKKFSKDTREAPRPKEEEPPTPEPDKEKQNE